MSETQPSGLARAMTWAVVVISAVLLALGIAWYGFSLEVHQRFWNDIFGRLHGPMTFRFVLQPTMALIAALPAGIADAKTGRHGFFWEARHHPGEQTGRLREGLIAAARIVLLGLSMDVIYQHRVFERFYPVEALMMALLLALVPYFIFRAIVERIARWRLSVRG